MTPRVRIHLCTYRRNRLLRRAIDSLLAQTYPHWICELHNDDPEDPVPDALVREIGDPRMVACTHTKNLGATATFNLLYSGTYAEDYLSLLEDDNWWEPAFLETMIAVMDRHPEVDLGWANMRCWHEESDNSWRDTGTHIWKTTTGEPILIPWIQPLQLHEALHSNGAMLVRSNRSTSHTIPAETPFDIVEPVRERTFKHPVLFVPEVLGNFSFTLQTARSKGLQTWADCQILMMASLFLQPGTSTHLVAGLWLERNTHQPRGTHLLLMAAWLSKRRDLLSLAGLADWALLIRSWLRHPLLTWRILRAPIRYPQLWSHLCHHAQARFQDARPKQTTTAIHNKQAAIQKELPP